MRNAAAATVIVLTALLASACGSSKPSAHAPGASAATTSTTTTTSTHGTAADGLRAAAKAWADAALTGSVVDIYDLQGPECLTGVRPSQTNLGAANAAIEGMRTQLKNVAGMPTAAVQAKIVDVSVRNVTAKTGEAEVRYDLPKSVTGNDNWVAYELVGGKWKVKDCRLPIGGSASSMSSATPAP